LAHFNLFCPNFFKPKHSLPNVTEQGHSKLTKDIAVEKVTLSPKTKLLEELFYQFIFEIHLVFGRQPSMRTCIASCLCRTFHRRACSCDTKIFICRTEQEVPRGRAASVDDKLLLAQDCELVTLMTAVRGRLEIYAGRVAFIDLSPPREDCERHDFTVIARKT